jgi:hypothetical protein
MKHRYFLACLLICSFVLTPLSTSVFAKTFASSEEMENLTALLPESELMIAIDGDRFLQSAVPNLLNNDLEKLRKLQLFVKNIEDNTGIMLADIKNVAVGSNVSSLSSSTSSLPNKFTAIVRTRNSNADVVETWAKKFDVIYRFNNEKRDSKLYIDSFKKFKDADYSDEMKKNRQNLLEQTQKSLQIAQEIGTRLKSLLQPSVKMVAENNKLIANLTKLAEAFKTDISAADLAAKAAKLAVRWNKIEINDANRVAKLNEILKESQLLYPDYALKYNNAKKLKSLISSIEASSEYDEDYSEKSFFEINLKHLNNVSTSLNKFPANAAARKTSLTKANSSLTSINSSLSSILESSELFENVPFNKPASVDKKLDKKEDADKSFYEEFKKLTKEETVNSKRFISINFSLLDENLDSNNDVKIGIGFLDDKTLAIGSDQAVIEILKRNNSYKNQRALELLNFSNNALVAFAFDSKMYEKNLAALPKSADAEKEKSPLDFSDTLKNMDIYGSINFNPQSAQHNEVSLSLGFLWSKSLMGKTVKKESNDDFESPGYNMGKELFAEIANSMRGVQASLIFKFEKEKIADLILSTPEIMNGEKTAAENFNKPVKLNNLQNLLVEPDFYIQFINSFR